MVAQHTKTSKISRAPYSYQFITCINTSLITCVRQLIFLKNRWRSVASLGGGGGANRPGWHPPGGWHPKEKILWANLQRIVEKRDRTGKKGVEWHPGRGDTRVKAIKSDSDSDSDEQKRWPGFEKKREEETRDDTGELATKKRSPGFSGKNWGWHVSCRPGCHQP